MASNSNLLLVILVLCFSASSTTASARNLSPKTSLSTRLMLVEDGSSPCWDSLLELHSCSGEVVLFFLNGETHLGPSCCNAIRIIQRQCWPSMLGSLGISTEESDILRGYCDATAAKGPPPPSSGSAATSHV
ncbi:egg cell-secreted protein 1.1-like [Primulina huaijiensis]|uniref:egg cell-secreted protein 1.1-like n=1 Tax=Primulina huaijiensis TaxID=1492673 RepID=UPI003CC75D11